MSSVQDSVTVQKPLVVDMSEYIPLNLPKNKAHCPQTVNYVVRQGGAGFPNLRLWTTKGGRGLAEQWN